MSELKINKCKSCGAKLDPSSAVGGVITCEYCGSKFTVARTTDDRVLNFLDSGELALDTCHFDDALAAFKKATDLDKNEPEAYFKTALAKFRVQYLKDETRNRLQPICHDFSDKKFTDDPDFMRACLHATPEQRAEYESKADEIDYIHGEFFKLKKSGLEYDCFICVKVTDDKTRDRTSDYKSADDIYFALKGKGYKPFFSERELEGVTGADYEARILYALYSSECMLIVCHNEDYLQTKWVKNEYTRFLKLVNDEEKESDAITVAFKGRVIERIPGKAGKIQGIDLNKLGALSRVEEFVENHTPEARKRKAEAAAAKKREDEEREKRLAEQQKALEEQRKAIEEDRRQREEDRRRNEETRKMLEDMQKTQQLAEEKRKKEEEQRLALEEQQRKAEKMQRELEEKTARAHESEAHKKEMERMQKQLNDAQNALERQKADYERASREREEAQRRAAEASQRYSGDSYGYSEPQYNYGGEYKAKPKTRPLSKIIHTLLTFFVMSLGTGIGASTSVGMSFGGIGTAGVFIFLAGLILALVTLVVRIKKIWKNNYGGKGYFVSHLISFAVGFVFGFLILFIE